MRKFGGEGEYLGLLCAEHGYYHRSAAPTKRRMISSQVIAPRRVGAVHGPLPEHHIVRLAPIEGGCHSGDDRVLDPCLDARDRMAGIAFIPFGQVAPHLR
jgi:hypothetical protein